VSIVLVGSGAVARSYHAPALASLHKGGWIGSVRLSGLSPARATEVAVLLSAAAGAPSWEVVLEGGEELATREAG
jgi:hypothetical protein